MGPTNSAPAPHSGAPCLWLIPGILNKPSDPDSWQDRGVTETLHRTAFLAEKGEYMARPITRRIGLTRKSRKIAERICIYSGRNIHLLVHSNGGEVARRIIRWALEDRPDYVPMPKFASITFLAPACDADFDANYLNAAFRAGILGRVVVNRAENDFPLKLGRASKRVFGVIGLGYGDLGLVGPRNVDPLYVDRVEDEKFPGYRHGTFTSGNELNQTLASVWVTMRLAEYKFPHHADWRAVNHQDTETPR